MMKGIVGVRIHLTRLEGKFKLSQNRSQPERENVIIELGKRGDENSTRYRCGDAKGRPRLASQWS